MQNNSHGLTNVTQTVSSCSSTEETQLNLPIINDASQFSVAIMHYTFISCYVIKVIKYSSRTYNKHTYGILHSLIPVTAFSSSSIQLLTSLYDQGRNVEGGSSCIYF
jgi:hypothetical protein